MARSLFHCVYEVNYHLVLVTKYRRKVITQEMLVRLRQIIDERVKAWEGEVREVNAEADHVHLLFRYHPNMPSQIL